ncbi:YebC/PmpR family DNA-binding transcriptional regulator [Halomonas halodenitrificans]|uniref:YebC/PmpR family DNA-binding transcriptional regulator n=1 Tax=Halomonas halodenitrificans TaxID=28252 RepID=UPI00047F7C3F|nr:YebC/PmpR family DNA-binding transcriptional regulator [Halomonas halodenitrificans]
MAGHSKWSNIKHRKAAQDAKRGKIFNKLIRELTVAARQGGPDTADNPRLRTAVDKALGHNMPKDTVQRAVDRGAGNADDDAMEECIYEGYGPEGVALMVECLTDNRNRTVSEVRHAFNKSGGNLGTSGSVAFMFHQQGRLALPAGISEEAVIEATLEAEPEDIVTLDDDTLEVVTRPDAYHEVKEALIAAGLTPERSELGLFPETTTPIQDEDLARKVVRLIDMLEDLDDVQNVTTNAEFDDAILDAIE